MTIGRKVTITLTLAEAKELVHAVKVCINRNAFSSLYQLERAHDKLSHQLNAVRGK